MERTLIAVEPDGTDWRVRLDNYPVARHPEGTAAIRQATEMARDCHRSIGVPTGVSVRLPCGDHVLLAACG